MASIKGFTLKKIINFCGHEEEPLVQGRIFYDEKDIGFFSQDFYGGESIVSFYDKKYYELAEQAARLFYEEYPEWNTYTWKNWMPNLEDMFTELLLLLDYEKAFNAASKQGYKALVSYIKGKDIYNEQVYKIKGDVAGYISRLKANANISHIKLFQALTDFEM